MTNLCAGCGAQFLHHHTCPTSPSSTVPMTTNPEQAETVPPLNRQMTRKVRDLVDRLRPADADLVLQLLGEMVVLHSQRNVARDDLATARRQRDERPAGRVVRRYTLGMDQRVLPSWLDEPPGTEVAVVVVADDSGTPEPRGIEPNESFTVQARVTSIEHPLPGRRDVADDSGEGE